MANNFSDYLEGAICDEFFLTGAAPTRPTSLVVALYTADPTEASTGGTEVTGGAYARQAITFGNKAANGTATRISNTAQIDFPQATADWGTVAYYAIFDNAGNKLIDGPLASSKLIQNGDIFRIPAGNCTIDID